MPNFVTLGQKVAEILHFFNFSSWWLAAILNFQIQKILTAGNVWRAEMYHISSKSIKQLQRY